MTSGCLDIRNKPDFVPLYHSMFIWEMCSWAYPLLIDNYCNDLGISFFFFLEFPFYVA